MERADPGVGDEIADVPGAGVVGEQVDLCEEECGVGDFDLVVFWVNVRVVGCWGAVGEDGGEIDVGFGRGLEVREDVVDVRGYV